VVEPRARTRFSVKSFHRRLIAHQLFLHQLDGDQTLQNFVERSIDRPVPVRGDHWLKFLLLAEVTPLAVTLPQDPMEDLPRGCSSHLFIHSEISRFLNLASPELSPTMVNLRALPLELFLLGPTF
jgi:hypothetical protein